MTPMHNKKKVVNFYNIICKRKSTKFKSGNLDSWFNFHSKYPLFFFFYITKLPQCKYKQNSFYFHEIFVILDVFDAKIFGPSGT